MRMGFRPLVNLSTPLGANLNSIFSSTTARSFVNPFLNQAASYPMDNNHLHQQSSKDEHNDDDDPDLKVELENKQLWDAFHSNGTEMVIIEQLSPLIICSSLCFLGDHEKWTVSLWR